MVPLFDSIEKAINKSSAYHFDALVPMLEGIVRKESESFLCNGTGSLPGGLSLDETIEKSISLGHPYTGMANLNLCIIGFSDVKRTMGAAFIQSNRKYKVETSYRDGLFFFLKKPPIVNYIHSLGRPPQTDAEFVTCMKLVFQADLKKAKEDGFNLSIGGGLIQRTEVTNSKKFKVKTVGSLGEPNLRAI